ncbi:hypothetical protein C7S18_03615 [Ahniella affigens]|uniref:Uncharacterized protein n=1 Tax=Ahniella affigens TaxID=2021234 RepID=A0A2P1PNB5_9GAMM|nr:hypothetical protein C7S18_03615 [Ahniella affigens]
MSGLNAQNQALACSILGGPSLARIASELVQRLPSAKLLHPLTEKRFQPCDAWPSDGTDAHTDPKSTRR